MTELIKDSIWLHAAIMDILRPYSGLNANRQDRMRTFAASNSFPDEAYAASVNQLKRLIVFHQTNHEISRYSVLWHTGLLYLANATLHSNGDSEWRLYFLLCISIYEGLKRPFPISGVTIKGLLSMALLHTDMSGSEARQILDQLDSYSLDRLRIDCERNVRATFIVDLDLALTDPESARVENMASNFEHLAAFQDFLDPAQIDSL